mgnify:CR=1 FL=1
MKRFKQLFINIWLILSGQKTIKKLEDSSHVNEEDRSSNAEATHNHRIVVSKSSVNTYSDLPLLGNLQGSLYYVIGEQKFYIYNDNEWMPLSRGGGGGGDTYWGEIKGTLDNQGDLKAKFENYYDKSQVDEHLDAKVSNELNPSPNDYAYVSKANLGGNGTVAIAESNTINTIVKRDDFGRIKCSEPASEDDAVNLKYYLEHGGGGGDAVWGEITGDINNQTDLQNLISKYVIKEENTSDYATVFAIMPGTSEVRQAETSEFVRSYTLAIRTGSGRLKVGSPVNDDDAVNLQYFNEHGGSGGNAVWGQITGEIQSQDDLMNKFTDYVYKQSNSSSFEQLYCIPPNSRQVSTLPADARSSAYSIVKRTAGGRVQVGEPEDDGDAINLKYFNEHGGGGGSTVWGQITGSINNQSDLIDELDKKVTSIKNTITTNDKVYIARSNSRGEALIDLRSDAEGSSIVLRDNDGHVKTSSSPSDSDDCVSLQYFNEHQGATWGNITGTLSNQEDLTNELAKYRKKFNNVDEQLYVYTSEEDSIDTVRLVRIDPMEDTVPIRDNYGRIEVGDPGLNNNACINRQYFHTNIGSTTSQKLMTKFNNEIVVDDLPTVGQAHTIYLRRVAPGVYETYIYSEDLQQFVCISHVDAVSGKEIGDVVMGDTLTSKQVVIARYGGQDWEQITGAVYGVGDQKTSPGAVAEQLPNVKGRTGAYAAFNGAACQGGNQDYKYANYNINMSGGSSWCTWGSYLDLSQGQTNSDGSYKSQSASCYKNGGRVQPSGYATYVWRRTA